VTDTLDESEVREIQDPDGPDLVEMETEASEEVADDEAPGDPHADFGLTGAVHIFNVGCSTGATTSFSVPINAFYWSTRLGYYRSDGSRIGLSPIVYWARSFYPPSVLTARFNGHIPSGTRDLRAFWWYGPPGEASPPWWNHVSVNC
jgi:hypothetical protein